MEKIIKTIEDTYQTKVTDKTEMMNILVIKFENGMSIDIPLKLIKEDK